MDLDERIVELVRQVKAAVISSQAANAEQGIRVGEVGLELKTVFSYEGGLAVKLLKLVEIGTNVSKENVQIISLTLTPAVTRVKKVISVEESLVEGFEVVRTAVHEAAASAPAFGLKEASVCINLGMAADGSIKVFVGAGAKWESTQTVKLQLLPVDG
jgi:hypothetical protein